jgi:hypothetical protein
MRGLRIRHGQEAENSGNLEIIANDIIELAKAGERDPNQMSEQALNAFRWEKRFASRLRPTASAE